MKGDPRLAKTFIAVMALAAIAGTLCASLASHAVHPAYALAILALAAATSKMKIKLPGIDGTMSVNLPFLLMAVVNLSALEAVSIAGLSTVVQCWPKPGSKFRPEQMLFNVCMMAFAASMASLIWNAGWLGRSSLGFRAAHVGLGNRRVSCRADCSGGRHHQTGRGHGNAARLAEHLSTIIPLLRS